VTKREWQIEMANRFAKRDNVNIEELDTRSYLIGRYDSTKTLTDEEISAVWASKKYDGEHFVDYIEFARDLLRKAQEK
jgi:hypothetical protein